MFCPKCAEAISSDDTKYCSKCGFTLKSVRRIFEKNGADENEISQFQKGLRLGIKLLLLALILLPVFQILGGFFVPDDKFVESSPSSSWFDFLGNAVLFALVLTGIARIFYALLFERTAKTSDSAVNSTNPTKEVSAKEMNALPPASSRPVSDFGKWKETTGDLFEPVFARRKTSGELK